MPLPNGFEWIVILVIALLILGPGKLPDVASAVGKSIREFRKASSEVQEAVKVDTSPLPPAPTATAPANVPTSAVPIPNTLSEPGSAAAPVPNTLSEPAPAATPESTSEPH
jgi:TatA/E family protein of Tat protein translocase